MQLAALEFHYKTTNRTWTIGLNILATIPTGAALRSVLDFYLSPRNKNSMHPLYYTEPNRPLVLVLIDIQFNSSPSPFSLSLGWDAALLPVLLELFLPIITWVMIFCYFGCWITFGSYGVLRGESILCIFQSTYRAHPWDFYYGCWY